MPRRVPILCVLLTAAGHQGNTGAVYLVSGLPAPPRNYCQTSPNSAGAGAVMTYRRSTSIADNTFRVRVEGAIPSQMGLFIYSFTPDVQPFGDGTLCLGANVVRLRDPLMIGPNGARQTLLDFTTPPGLLRRDGDHGRRARALSVLVPRPGGGGRGVQSLGWARGDLLPMKPGAQMIAAWIPCGATAACRTAS